MGLIFSVKGYMGIVWGIIAIGQDIGENPSGELHRVSVLGKKEAKLEWEDQQSGEWFIRNSSPVGDNALG